MIYVTLSVGVMRYLIDLSRFTGVACGVHLSLGMNGAKHKGEHMNTLMYGDTKYYGIWVQRNDAHFWICDANGGDEYIGLTAPTEEQIEQYREAVRG